MNISAIIKSLRSERENFRKNKSAKSRWSEEFQFKVLQIIESGYSVEKLSRELKISVQTLYHWKRRWPKHPKYEASKSYLLPNLNKAKKQNFRKVKISDKLVNCPAVQNPTKPSMLSTVIILPNGVRVENISEEILTRLLYAI